MELQPVLVTWVLLFDLDYFFNEKPKKNFIIDKSERIQEEREYNDPGGYGTIILLSSWIYSSRFIYNTKIFFGFSLKKNNPRSKK